MENFLYYVCILFAFITELGEVTPAGRQPKRHPVSTEREVKHGFKNKKKTLFKETRSFLSQKVNGGRLLWLFLLV